MKRKIMAILIALTLLFALAACGAGEETTLPGMVVAVDGTVISFTETDDEMDFSQGNRPEMPEDFEGFENFNPEDFEGQLPEGGEMPQWEDGEMPQMPEGMTPPEGMPEGGERPDFGGEGGKMPNFESFASDLETTQYDLADAHISLEIDGGKESGSMDDIQPGSMVTLTVNGKGQVTYVLVSSRMSFGGGRFAN